VLGPTSPGRYRMTARMIGYGPLTIARELRGGVVDTVQLRLVVDTSAIIFDCLGPQRRDGSRGFGSQLCKPR